MMAAVKVVNLVVPKVEKKDPLKAASMVVT